MNGKRTDHSPDCSSTPPSGAHPEPPAPEDRPNAAPTMVIDCSIFCNAAKPPAPAISLLRSKLGRVPAVAAEYRSYNEAGVARATARTHCSPKPRLGACTLAANGRADAEVSGDACRAAAPTNTEPSRGPVRSRRGLLLRVDELSERQSFRRSPVGDEPGVSPATRRRLVAFKAGVSGASVATCETDAGSPFHNFGPGSFAVLVSDLDAEATAACRARLGDQVARFRRLGPRGDVAADPRPSVTAGPMLSNSCGTCAF